MWAARSESAPDALWGFSTVVNEGTDAVAAGALSVSGLRDSGPGRSPARIVEEAEGLGYVRCGESLVQMLKWRKRGSLTWACALGSLGVLLACRAMASTAMVERLIPEDPGQLLQPADVFEAVEVARWPLRTLADLEGWTIKDTAVTEEAQGLRFRVSGPHPQLERKVTLDAAAVDALRVQGRARSPWTARVSWNRAGEKFARQRSADSGGGEKRRAAVARREIALDSIAEWSGRIVRLRVRLASKSNKDVHLTGITAVRYRPDPERWEDATRRAWKVELPSSDVGDVRNALLAPRERPITRFVSAPPNARLLFDYGLRGHPPGRLCFKVRAAPATGQPLDLFAHCLEPHEANRWISASADLAALAGRRVQLGFEIAGDPGDTMPVWGNPEIVPPAAQQPPNVVLISIDTLRADRLSLYGYRRPTSPQLDRWARDRAVIFDQAIAPAPWTVPSHVSMLTGLSPLRHGVNYDQAAPLDLTTIAEVLRTIGYNTLAVTGGGFLAPWTGLSQGFDRYAYWRERGGKRGEAELANNVDLARQWLRAVSRKPFFLFFHTYEVHSPYLPRSPFFSRFNESGLPLPASEANVSGNGPAADAGFVLTKTAIWGRSSAERPFGDGAVPREELPLLDALYDSGVAYMDQEIGRLLETLRELGLDRRTVVILTSDHGEALGENGLGGHAYLLDINLRVPLLLALPDGRQAGKHVGAQVQSLDIVPTVLDALGIPPPGSVEGRSLLPLLSAQPAPGRVAWSYAASSNHGIALRLDRGPKYLFNNSAWLPVQGQERLFQFDEKTGQEREERDDVARTHALRRELFNHYKLSGPPALEVAIVNHFGTELRGRLRANTLGPTQVKALDSPPGLLRWHRRSVEFAVPPERRLTLFLEGSVGEELRVFLDTEPAADSMRVRERVRLNEVTLPLALQLNAAHAASWRAGALPHRASGVELVWRGRAHRMPEKAASIPEDAKEQLRALGYLE